MESFMRVQNDTLAVEVSIPEEKITILDAQTGYRLFISEKLTMFSPELDGKIPDFTLRGARREDKRIELAFGSDRADYYLTISLAGSDIRFEPRLENVRAGELNALHILPPGSGINFFDLVNFRNRHGSSFTWPELNLADQVDTTTFSTDWQFAPHPSLFVFRRDDIQLLVAPVDRQKAFGYHYRSKRYRLENWTLDYGPKGCGLTIEGTVGLPAFTMLKHTGGTVYDALDDYCALLIREGRVPDPAQKPRFSWHRANLYCTWCDQCAMTEALGMGGAAPIELEEQAKMEPRPQKLLTEAMVRGAAEIIRRERLPFTTFLIDDGWQRALGDWRADKTRFPDFRGLIDDLHAMGFKVILWINLADIAPETQVDERFLVPGYINRHGRRVWNYSDPVVQRDYLEPLVRRLISPERGCYDADGIKTDFLADKVHPDTPCAPEWRGEENYYEHLFSFVYRAMRRIKADACHLGCAGHPFLAQYMDIIRTYDFVSTNMREQLERARMVAHSSCRAPVAFDFHGCMENYTLYFETARRFGYSVEIGKIMYTKRDAFAPVEPADEAFYEFLRRELASTEAALGL